MGGLARRATLVQQVRQEGTGPVLLVDAGNSLMGESLSLRSDGRVMVEAMNQMGYDALGVGSGELLKGPEVLAARAGEARFAIVSCNLVEASTGTPVLEPWALVERGGLRAAIVGVTSPQALQGLEALWPGVTVLPPEQVLPDLIEEVRGQVDLVIVLSQLGLEGDTALASAVPGIDVIVGGSEHYVLTEPTLVGETTIVQAGYDGEWLGRLGLQGPADALAYAAYQILYMRPDVADDPAMNELVQRYYRAYP